MFEKLQRKWKVNGLDLLLILTTFALGGSICGYVSRRIIGFIGVENEIASIVIYIIILTITWPPCVILTSIPLGQYKFFKKYIFKIFNRFRGKSIAATPEKIATKETTNLAIFASGAGSNAKKIIEHFERNPDIRIALIICNKPGAGVLDIAKKYKIDTLIIERERFFKGDAYINELKKYRVNKIILAGFLWKIPTALLNEWPSSIINIHPALLPKYGGKGMYGQYVHEAVIANNEKESGISIHYVDEIYDNGAIILQEKCEVTETDTPETLAKKIHELEHRYYPITIERVINAKNSLNKTVE